MRTEPTFLVRILAGVAAGVAAGFVMNQYARAVHQATRGREGDGAAPGVNRVGRGVQPPQANALADRDAAVRVGAGVYEIATGVSPSLERARAMGVAAHYAFSGALGAVYAALYERVPAVRAGRGLLFGAAVWAIADETVLPAMKLSRGPHRLGPRVLLYGLTGHLIFGAALDRIVAWTTSRRDTRITRHVVEIAHVIRRVPHADSSARPPRWQTGV